MHYRSHGLDNNASTTNDKWKSYLKNITLLLNSEYTYIIQQKEENKPQVVLGYSHPNHPPKHTIIPKEKIEEIYNSCIKSELIYTIEANNRLANTTIATKISNNYVLCCKFGFKHLSSNIEKKTLLDYAELFNSPNFQNPHTIKNTHKVLIIADEQNDQTSLTKTLEKSLHTHILRAENGVKAIEICKAHNDLSLILIDTQLPLINGIEIAKIIKSIHPNVHIINYIPHNFNFNKTQILQNGNNAYIQKTLKWGKIIDLIERYLFCN